MSHYERPFVGQRTPDRNATYDLTHIIVIKLLYLFQIMDCHNIYKTRQDKNVYLANSLNNYYIVIFCTQCMQNNTKYIIQIYNL